MVGAWNRDGVRLCSAPCSWRWRCTCALRSRRPPSQGSRSRKPRRLSRCFAEELLPDAFRGRSPQELETMWPRWVEARDAAIRQRVVQGDEDSVIHLVLFGTTFTKRPRPTDSELNALFTRPADGKAALRPRVDDFIAGVRVAWQRRAPAVRARCDRARGHRPRDGAWQDQTREFLRRACKRWRRAARRRRRRWMQATRSRRLPFTVTAACPRTPRCSWTMASMSRSRRWPVRGRRPVRSGGWRSWGRGLDFTDKLWGYDFYPPQTIQPFAVIDSLIRHGLSSPGDVRVTAFDLSPQVIQHLEAARGRAAARSPYGLVLPRNLDRSVDAGAGGILAAARRSHRRRNGRRHPSRNRRACRGPQRAGAAIGRAHDRAARSQRRARETGDAGLRESSIS